MLWVQVAATVASKAPATQVSRTQEMFGLSGSGLSRRGCSSSLRVLTLHLMPYVVRGLGLQELGTLTFAQTGNRAWGAEELQPVPPACMLSAS